MDTIIIIIIILLCCAMFASLKSRKLKIPLASPYYCCGLSVCCPSVWASVPPCFASDCLPREQDVNIEASNAYHLRGVNLGSWMVLEPWITPSMFFQFLGKVYI